MRSSAKAGWSAHSRTSRLPDLSPRYLETVGETLSPATYEFYSSVIRRCILPALGNHKLSQIKPVHVQAFVSQLKRHGIPDTTRKQAHFPEYGQAVSVRAAIHIPAGSQAGNYCRKNPASADETHPQKARKAGGSTFSPNKRQPAMLEALEQEPRNFKC